MIALDPFHRGERDILIAGREAVDEILDAGYVVSNRCYRANGRPPLQKRGLHCLVDPYLPRINAIQHQDKMEDKREERLG